MVISSGELDRIADDIDKDRRITTSVHCGGCGYNLRTLPYLYTCPECGNKYNARPRKMKGIFNPNAVSFPARDLLLTFASVFGVLFFGATSIHSPSVATLLLAGFFAIMAVLSGREAYVRLCRFVKAFSIIRRIEAEEEDGD